MNKINKLIVLGFLFIAIVIFAQSPDITSALMDIESGKLDNAREKLEKLKKTNPNSPEVLFLEGVLIKEGNKALEKYKEVFEKYPGSKYADAALYRTFSYYYAVGSYKRAEKYLNELKKKYPGSPYIKAANRTIPSDDEVTVTESNPPDKEKQIFPKKEYYTIQAGAFTSYENAKKMQKRFKKAGLTSKITSKQVGGSFLNIVTVGKFSSRKEAEKFLKVLKRDFSLEGRIKKVSK